MIVYCPRSGDLVKCNEINVERSFMATPVYRNIPVNSHTYGVHCAGPVQCSIDEIVLRDIGDH